MSSRFSVFILVFGLLRFSFFSVLGVSSLKVWFFVVGLILVLVSTCGCLLIERIEEGLGKCVFVGFGFIVSEYSFFF